MAEIKSAWEIALARTENIKADKSLLEAHDIKQKGKRLISELLTPVQVNGQEKTENAEEVFKKALKSFYGKQHQYFKEGAFETLKANLILPRNGFDQAKLEPLEKAFTLIIPQKSQIRMIFQQLSQFFQQYTENRSQLKEELEKQYASKLKQKELELSQQVGSPIHLDPQQDPEFLKLLKDNYNQLENHYQGALDRAKQELDRLFASSR